MYPICELCEHHIDITGYCVDCSKVMRAEIDHLRTCLTAERNAWMAREEDYVAQLVALRDKER